MAKKAELKGAAKTAAEKKKKKKSAPKAAAGLAVRKTQEAKVAGGLLDHKIVVRTPGAAKRSKKAHTQGYHTPKDRIAPASEPKLSGDMVRVNNAIKAAAELGQDSIVKALADKLDGICADLARRIAIDIAEETDAENMRADQVAQFKDEREALSHF